MWASSPFPFVLLTRSEILDGVWLLLGGLELTILGEFKQLDHNTAIANFSLLAERLLSCWKPRLGGSTTHRCRRPDARWHHAPTPHEKNQRQPAHQPQRHHDSIWPPQRAKPFVESTRVHVQLIQKPHLHEDAEMFNPNSLGLQQQTHIRTSPKMTLPILCSTLWRPLAYG